MSDIKKDGLQDRIESYTKEIIQLEEAKRAQDHIDRRTTEIEDELGKGLDIGEVRDAIEQIFQGVAEYFDKKAKRIQEGMKPDFDKLAKLEAEAAQLEQNIAEHNKNIYFLGEDIRNTKEKLSQAQAEAAQLGTEEDFELHESTKKHVLSCIDELKRIASNRFLIGTFFSRRAEMEDEFSKLYTTIQADVASLALMKAAKEIIDSLDPEMKNALEEHLSD